MNVLEEANPSDTRDHGPRFFLLLHMGHICRRGQPVTVLKHAWRRESRSRDKGLVTVSDSVSPLASCRTTTLVNRAPILTDTLQRRTPKRQDLMPPIPILQPLSQDTAQPGPTIPTSLHNIGQPQQRPFPEPRSPAPPPRTLPIGGPASPPPTHPRAMRTP